MNTYSIHNEEEASSSSPPTTSFNHAGLQTHFLPSRLSCPFEEESIPWTWAKSFEQFRNQYISSDCDQGGNVHHVIADLVDLG